jgi:hypothetical protein
MLRRRLGARRRDDIEIVQALGRVDGGVLADDRRQLQFDEGWLPLSGKGDECRRELAVGRRARCGQRQTARRQGDIHVARCLGFLSSPLVDLPAVSGVRGRPGLGDRSRHGERQAAMVREVQVVELGWRRALLAGDDRVVDAGVPQGARPGDRQCARP